MAFLLRLALVAVVATALGINDDRVELDKGLIDGLRSGDEGKVFYTLMVGGRPVRIEAGSARIVEVDDFRSWVVASEGKPIRAGYAIEFQADPRRLAPSSLLDLANQRLEQTNYPAALSYFRRLNELLPGDPLVTRRIAEIEAAPDGGLAQRREKERLDYYRLAARASLEEGDWLSARSYIDKVLDAAPTDSEAMQLQETVLRLERLSGMVHVPAGEYLLGVGLDRASHYNQQPRFSLRLREVWLDRRPVAAKDLVGAREDRDGVPAVSVSFAEAAQYCDSRGKRLPSEFEWEVASALGVLEMVPGISEWTGSWYKPYPGNTIAEPEYGDKFRVVRGYLSDGEFSPKSRFFMSPTQRAPDIGFRCAWDATLGR